MFGRLVCVSAAMRLVAEQLRRVAASNSTVLLTGRTGTGKTAAARALHDASPRRAGPFVVVDCPALMDTVMQSEVFGHVRGAFTGAVASRAGRFEVADGGTVFFDDVGDLPLSMQGRVIRFVQSHEFEPVGSSNARRVDVRVVAATNLDLRELVARGSFREDLYYRLNVIEVQMPSLHERKEDIPALARAFCERLAGARGRSVRFVTENVLAQLIGYDWPGNVRQLEHVLERAEVLLAEDAECISEVSLPARAVAFTKPAGASASRRSTRKKHIDWSLHDALRAELEIDKLAAALGVGRSTLFRERKKRSG